MPKTGQRGGCIRDCCLDELQLLASGDGTLEVLEFVRRLAFDAGEAAFDAAFATDGERRCRSRGACRSRAGVARRSLGKYIGRHPIARRRYGRVALTSIRSRF
jgi:hypothetical protein